MSDYNKAVVFSEGVHYPVAKDGHPDTTRPLRWVEGTTYRDAKTDESQHNEIHHVSDAAIVPGSE